MAGRFKLIQLDTKEDSWRSNLSSLLSSDDYSDTKIFVHSKGVCQKIIPVHKVILAVSSPVFKNIFSESSEIVNCEVHDVDLEIFDMLLNYIYLHPVMLRTVEETSKLHSIACRYEVSRLREECAEFLVNNMSEKTALGVYSYAKDGKEIKLMEKAREYIGDNTLAVLGDQSFSRASLGTVTDIFAMNQLEIDSELDLVKALFAYKTNNKLEDEQCMKPMTQVRLLSLSKEEIAGSQELHSLLPSDYVYSLLLNRTAENSHVPLPEGLNMIATGRKRRERVVIEDSLSSEDDIEKEFLSDTDEKEILEPVPKPKPRVESVFKSTRVDISDCEEDDNDEFPPMKNQHVPKKG